MAQQPKQKPRRLSDRAPWKPAAWEPAEVSAVQALLQGTANPGQQKLALKFVIEKLAGTYEAHFHPGPDGTRSTDFALGMAHVGQQLVKCTKLNVTRLTSGQASEQA